MNFLVEKDNEGISHATLTCKQPGYSISQFAVLQGELRQLEKRYFSMKKEFDRSKTKLDSYVMETKKLRGRNTAAEKELHCKNILLKRLKHDKSQIEAQAVANREYASKIEQKLAMGAKGQAIAHKNNELRSTITDLQRQIDIQTNQLKTKQEEVEKLGSEKSVLRRALEVRVKEMGLGGNIQNGLLYEVARLKEQNNNMALQLAKHVQHASSLEVSRKLESRDTF